MVWIRDPAIPRAPAASGRPELRKASLKMTTRRTIVYSLAMLTLFGLTMGLTGCGDSGGGTTPETATQQKPVTSPKGDATYDPSKEAPSK